RTVIGGAPELFGPPFEHCKEEGLVAGVGAVVTACQRVGIRSQVQRLSRPHRGRDGRARRRRRGPRPQTEITTNGDAAISSNGSEPLPVDTEVSSNGAGVGEATALQARESPSDRAALAAGSPSPASGEGKAGSPSPASEEGKTSPASKKVKRARIKAQTDPDS